MRVLLVSNMYPTKETPTFGTFVKVFADGLSEYRPGYEIDMVVIEGASKGKLEKLFKYIRFYTHLLFNLLFRSYDIVYVHTITFPTPPLRIASMFRNLNLIFNVHGVDVLTKSRLAERLKQLCRPLLMKSRYVVVPSSYFKRIVISEFPELDEEKLIVSASGGVEKKFFSLKMQRQSADRIKIGYVSRIVKGKGWDVFLKALKILDDRKVTFEAILIGTGTEVDELIKSIEESDYRNMVEYLGAVGHDKLPDYYKSMDLFVFPSESESLGLVGLEAMAANVPVIGSNIGGIATYVKDGVNGFLFTPGNAIELADNIVKFAGLDETLRNKMMQSAYNTAMEYETSVVLKKLFNVIFPINE